MFAAKICFFVKQTDFCTVVNYDEMRGMWKEGKKNKTCICPTSS